jgi:hypothetical protein
MRWEVGQRRLKVPQRLLIKGKGNGNGMSSKSSGQPDFIANTYNNGDMGVLSTSLKDKVFQCYRRCRTRNGEVTAAKREN